ncbi:hypothetical protein SDC9_40633 [bioreactor metagenome]|uniref:Integron Cassette Protein Hfx-Cass5 domain-containing protein n=1 Tax=bioreactor metagenome TaxID=1076179 RepID=A0A644VSV7_9ZZZZ
MKNWFKKDKFVEYKDRLKEAFPKSLESDLNVVLEIIPFADNRVKLCDGNTHTVANLIHENFYTTLLDSNELKIPYRLYFNEPTPENEKTLSEKQQAILNCIYLRHHNGYLRQKRLEKLKGIDFYWITPFTFQLLGEYVFEILEVLDNQLDDSQLENYKKYALENPKYWQQTESRMISYWNEYYRFKSPKIKTYIGRLIFDQIKIKTQGFRVDEIIEIGIDSKERLFLKPKREKFTLIYRTATEVHWDEKGKYLYSPKPREWDYLDWYKQITSVIETDCNCRLLLTYRTTWTNISDELKKQIKIKKATA